MPVSISVHPRHDSHCRLARRALYCPSEDEVLHEQGAGRHSTRGLMGRFCKCTESLSSNHLHRDCAKTTSFA
ncbi:hypothetical protein A2U01_0061362 [Trifolium medium]|uniref:Uncharacterized protein n=1 Tax=Trifolium medium TaxID=97028 RepID=A0A392RWF5_9FABA|nr:hypothetical protein [Trifolium medium]